MSGYGGRRAPNFSQYLNDLNTIPSPYDQAMQQQEQQDLFDVDAELALFTNAEFLDFDTVGDLSANVSANFDTIEEDHTRRDSLAVGGGQGLKYMDMLNDFNVPNYPDYSTSVLSMQTPGYPGSQQSTTSNRNGGSLSSGDIVQQVAPQAGPAPSPTTPANGAKRKQDAVGNSAQALDIAARLAQEEDKRRRNTAASARFRVKKKEREKNLERTVKDVTAKNAALEARINQLEMENRLLKNLITEKNGSVGADGDITGMVQTFREGKETLNPRPTENEHGVGAS